MYALGVNLARQLGDVRPLVENSEELTQLARGLLDTVVGKIDDEDQRNLLGRRGEDLNNIILEQKSFTAGYDLPPLMQANPNLVVIYIGKKASKIRRSPKRSREQFSP